MRTSSGLQLDAHRTYIAMAHTLGNTSASMRKTLHRQVHGVDVEGMQLGIDEELVALLGRCSPVPVTYAGGARTLVRMADTIWPCGTRLQTTPSYALALPVLALA